MVVHEPMMARCVRPLETALQRERATSVDRSGGILVAGQAMLDEQGPVDLRGQLNWDKEARGDRRALVVLGSQGCAGGRRQGHVRGTHRRWPSTRPW